MPSYSLGPDSNAIALSVTVNSPANGNTSAALRKSAHPTVIVASSGSSGTSIRNAAIGTAANLRSGQLVIQTWLTFGNIKKSEVQKAIAALVVKYKLTGGPQELTFKSEPGDIITGPSGKAVIVTKIVDLI